VCGLVVLCGFVLYCSCFNPPVPATRIVRAGFIRGLNTSHARMGKTQKQSNRVRENKAREEDSRYYLNGFVVCCCVLWCFSFLVLFVVVFLLLVCLVLLGLCCWDVLVFVGGVVFVFGCSLVWLGGGVVLFWFRGVLRRVCWVREREGVPEELRGWAWDRFPVRPRGFFGLGVSEVAYRYCATFRDLWLRRRLGVRPVVRRGSPIWWGRVMHCLLDAAFRDVRSVLEKGVEHWRAYEILSGLAWRRAGEAGAPGCGDAAGFYRSIVLMLLGSSLASSCMHGGEGVGWLPPPTEYRVDGSPLGLSSQLRVDALGESGVVVEFKLGMPNGDGRHRVGLAGYALALEAELEIPVDYGLIVYFSSVSSRPRIKVEPVFIHAGLRREFLENRDEAIDVLMQPRPPGKPPRGCSKDCPYYEQCMQV